MRIVFEGDPKRISTQECRKVLHFYGSLLLSKKQRKGLKLYVDFDTGFHRREDSLAEVGPDEKGLYWLTIDDNLARETTLRALAHEMVHVKQFAKGELYEHHSRDNIAVFNCKSIDVNKHNYWDLPWEIEAYGRATGLYYRYLDKLSYENKIRRKAQKR